MTNTEISCIDVIGITRYFHIQYYCLIVIQVSLVGWPAGRLVERLNMLKKVKNIRAFEQAVEQLRDAILEGQFVLGDRLPTEQVLCETLDVSRSTIREALRVLEAEGLIEVRRGSGAYVASKLDSLATRGEILKWLAQREESVIQILEVREGIEWMTASLTASNHTDELISELRNHIVAQRAESDRIKDSNDIAKITELDVAFHTAISLASGNEIAHEIISQILPSFSEANKALIWAGKGIEQSIEEHVSIFEAIQDRNASAAEKAMRNHIRRVREEICSFLAEDCVER